MPTLMSTPSVRVEVVARGTLPAPRPGLSLIASSAISPAHAIYWVDSRESADLLLFSLIDAGASLAVVELSEQIIITSKSHEYR